MTGTTRRQFLAAVAGAAALPAAWATDRTPEPVRAVQGRTGGQRFAGPEWSEVGLGWVAPRGDWRADLVELGMIQDGRGRCAAAGTPHAGPASALAPRRRIGAPHR